MEVADRRAGRLSSLHRNMAYWLFKSEPATWSFADQLRRGAKGEPWDGVRNHQAANNMKAMQPGDLGFFYHSGAQREVIGIVEVICAFHPDPSDTTGRFGMVTVKAVKPLPEPVPLAAIKDEPALGEMALVRQSRLSVMPVTAAQWRLICRMGGLRDTS